MLLEELIDDAPIWYTIIDSGLKKGRKFYFASGANRIYKVVMSPSSIRLLLTNRKTGEGKAYTMVSDNFDKWTMRKFEDGHRLVMVQNVKESVDDPITVSMFKKLIANGNEVFFMDKAGKVQKVGFVKSGDGIYGKKMWRFYYSSKDGESGTSGAVVWKDENNIDKLSLKKMVHTRTGSEPVWTLYDTSKVKLKEDTQEPFIVTLMNQRIAKGGAILLNAKYGISSRMKGWVTRPIVRIETRDGLGNPTGPFWKMVTNDHPSGAKGKSYFLTQTSDEKYTLKKTKDGNGNTVISLIDREGSDEAA